VGLGVGRGVMVLAGQRAVVGAGCAPVLELGVAVAAGAAGDSPRVEVGVLVEGHLEGAVLVAEDVAALAAVVAAREVAKVPLAGRVVTNGGLVVGLPMSPSGRACGLRKLIEIPHAANGFGAVARRPPAQPAECAQAAKAHEAAAGPQAILDDIILILDVWLEWCWLGWKLGGT